MNASLRIVESEFVKLEERKYCRQETTLFSVSPSLKRVRVDNLFIVFYDHVQRAKLDGLVSLQCVFPGILVCRPTITAVADTYLSISFWLVANVNIS